MKRKMIEALATTRTRKQGQIVTAQILENILILNFFKDKALYGRYCIVPETGEHESWKPEEGWRKVKLESFLGGKPSAYYYDAWRLREMTKDIKFNRKEDEDTVGDFLGEKKGNIWTLIDSLEEDHDREKRWDAEGRMGKRLRDRMDRIPDAPDDFRKWLFGMAAGEYYMFWNKEGQRYGCSKCGYEAEERELKREDGGRKIRHNDYVVCPDCKERLQVKKRTHRMARKTACYLIQPAGDEFSVIRFFDVEIEWTYRRCSVCVDEGIRIFAYKDGQNRRNKKRYAIYFNQGCSRMDFWGIPEFDKGNWRNRRAKEGYLYPGNIKEILNNTSYKTAGRLLEKMAGKGICADYNKILIGDYAFTNYSRTLEYLLEGRFKKLLRQTVGETDWWGNGSYNGSLRIDGESIEEVMRIGDRQKINRLRDMDGGEAELQWLQYSDRCDQKIPQDTLIWLARNEIKPEGIKRAGRYMRPQQIQNYIIKQQKASYPNLDPKEILEQWEDYLQMCESAGKRIDDEMVYRPRELKRRHDEAITELNQIRILKAMDENTEYKEAYSREMREKFPNAEETLRDIKERYEYEDEEYLIRVPENLLEIVTDGQALHHCAGTTERYFERIENRETYICLLRRKSAPKIPYYTIEVEPSGTIRQHRSYLDEEPGIEEIRPFLKRWQQELKKRLTEEDRRLAKISKAKRYENIKELEEKRNIRVLKALEEDFLENVLEEVV